MAEKKIGAKIVIDGESEFRASMISAKKALDNFDSELNKINKTYKNNANSLEALRAKQQVYTKLQEEQTHKVSLLTEMQDKAVKKLEEEQYTLTALSNRRELLNQRLEEAKKTYGENSDEVQNLNKELEDINKQYTEQERVVQKTNDKVNNYQTQLNNAEAELSDLNSEIAQNDKYLNEAENSTDGCAKSIDEYGNEVKDASKETSIFSEVLKAELLSSAIKEGLKALAEGIKNIATAATETGMQFESSMSQVAATMGITTKEIAEGSKSFEILTKAAQDCGKSTMFSASQAGEALNYLALAGYDAEKAAATLPKVLNLAAAGGLDLAYASDLVTDSMAALGMETSDLDNYIDQMAKTSQKSNTSVAQLGEATLVCAGAVKLAEQDINTMNTVLGVLANNGIKGAEGGTHLRNIILSLSSPTDNAATAMEELGLEIEDSNGSMRNLEDIIIDMNDAMSQLSSVEKTKMISKIFNKTDIGAVNALLKSTNGEFKNLKSQIKDCSGAAQEMADTLNDNLKGKITILQSALEGLGITTYDLFDDTMKSAVDSATDAVGRLQDSIDNGDLGVSLRNMSDALGEFAEKALGTAEDAVPKLIDGLTWILENGEILASLIGGITTAKITYTVATKAATIAQEVFNLTCNANPYIMLATAIGGIVSAIAIYSATAEDAGIKLSENTEKIIKSSKKLTDESKKASKERADTRDGFDAQRDAAVKLVNELDELRNKTSLTTEEQTREKAIIDELNTAFPELNIAINEQTGEINLSTDAIMQNIDAQLALMKVEAAREDLTQIAKEQYEEEKKLAELMSEKEEAANRLAEAEKNLTDVQEAMREGWGARADLEEANQVFEIATNDVNELSNSIEESNNRISELKSEYEATTQYIADNNQVYEETANALDGLGDAADSTGDAIVAMSDEAVEAYNKMYEDICKNIENQMNLFDEFTAKCDLSTDQILKNMESQIDGIKQWSDNLKILAERGIEQGFLHYLADMGPQGAGYVAQFVKMTDDEFKKANDLYKESMILPASITSEILDSWYQLGQKAPENYGNGIESQIDTIIAPLKIMQGQVADESYETANILINEFEEGIRKDPLKLITAGENVGKDYLSGMDSGILEGKVSTLELVKQLGPDLVKELRKSIDSNDLNSPSKETEKVGNDYDLGVSTGIKDKTPEILTQIKNTSKAMLDTTKANIQKSEYEAIGRSVTEGIANGISSGQSEVINSVIQLCTSAVNTAKSELKINSPSKKFEYLGEMSGQGYITGWEQTMQNIDSIIMDTLPDLPSGSKNNVAGAQAATKTILPDNLINKMEQQNANILDVCNKMQTMIAKYMPQMANMQIVTNTGALIGELMPGLDNEFGNMKTEKERGVL